MKKDYLKLLRGGEELSFGEQLAMIIRLSIPAVLAQISSIIMQYIDAAMVGHLGSGESAAIGLVSTSTWLLYGLCTAASVGFTIQIAQKIGADNQEEARNIVKTGLISVSVFSVVLAVIGALISGILPGLLGGAEELFADASGYFLIFALFLPAHQLNSAAGGMLQCSGNIKLPSILNILMCLLDVIYNFLLIFPTREIMLGDFEITVPGAGLGVYGAALGTAFSEATIVIFMLFSLLFRSEQLRLRRNEKLRFNPSELKSAVKLALPVALEQVVTCGAYIASTTIIAPLGTAAIAANSFSVTAESLCYMPGYGIGTAASAIIGQGVGAGRYSLTKRLGWLSIALGMTFMVLSGALMFVFAPYMIGFLSDDAEICALGTSVLRIEAFAEPLYAASIVASGVFRGEGDTLIPSCLNFFSMWIIRIPLSAYLAPIYGLNGVWTAMCIELCVRGTMFLIRMAVKKQKIPENL